MTPRYPIYLYKKRQNICKNFFWNYKFFVFLETISKVGRILIKIISLNLLHISVKLNKFYIAEIGKYRIINKTYENNCICIHLSIIYKYITTY